MSKLQTTIKVEFTRPADTTAYIAKDVVGTDPAAVITFPATVKRTGRIVKARLMTDKKDCAARFRLHLFREAPTAIADNSPYLLLYANRDNRIGHIDFPQTQTEDATNSTAANAMNDILDLPYNLASRIMSGVLMTLDAFNPASAQKFYLELTVEEGL